MVKFYDICFEVRKSARVWFSFSLLWKCETPPAGANCMLLEVLSSPSSWVTSAPPKAAEMTEASWSTRQHEHLLKQAWVKDSLLPDAAPRLTRVWAKHSSTTGSSVQTHSCYFKSSFYTPPSILRNWFMLVESLLGELTPSSCKSNSTRVAPFHANNSKWNFSDNVPWGISPQSQHFMKIYCL